MADEGFTDPRLAAMYDVLDPDRSDLDAYIAMAGEFGARRVLDIGCGTGVLALLLADRGLEVTGVDPAAASVRVARGKPGAGRVRWVVGDASAVGPVTVDLVTMTANVAQAIVAPDAWASTLDAAREALAPEGRLVFETRDPAFQGWREWTREQTLTQTDVPGEGVVESWCELLEVALPLVRFRWTYRFADGTVRASDSTLRFRSRDELADDLEKKNT